MGIIFVFTFTKIIISSHRFCLITFETILIINPCDGLITGPLVSRVCQVDDQILIDLSDKCVAGSNGVKGRGGERRVRLI